MVEKVNLHTLRWFREPQLYILNDEKLVLETEPHTDMRSFRDEEHNAFGLLGNMTDHVSFRLRMDFSKMHPGDECGALLRMSDYRWLRFGITQRDKEVSEIFADRVLADMHDRSIREVGSGIVALYLKVEYSHGHAVFSYSMNDTRYTLLRTVDFPDQTDAVQAGLYACSRDDSYFDATFSRIEKEHKKEK